MAEDKLTQEQIEVIQKEYVEQLKIIFAELPNLRPIAIIGYDGNGNIVLMPFADMPFNLIEDTIIPLGEQMKVEKNKRNKNVN